MTSTQPCHTITRDERRGTLHVSLSGFWSREAMFTGLTDLESHIQAMGEGRSSLSLVINVTGFLPQDRTTAELFRHFQARWTQMLVRRIAFFGATTLVKMQFRRLCGPIEAEFFATAKEATHWAQQSIKHAKSSDGQLACGASAAF